MLKAFKLRVCLLILILSALSSVHAQGGLFQTSFTGNEQTLTLQILRDDLVHFAFTPIDSKQDPLWTTPMIATSDETFAGPSKVNLAATNIIETPALRLEIDETTLCITATDLTRDPALLLTTTCPLNDDGELVGLTLTKEGTTDIYGLGEQFQRRGGTEGNWMGKRRNVLNAYGNELAAFNGGNVGNAQFPIMYALGAGTDNYALFLDDVYQQLWEFTGDPFTVRTTNTVVRGYLIAGPSLADLRTDYMTLTGTPPVPPKQAFGLWVSEYGYESWDELNSVLKAMQDAKFPQDGFVLDLQWFGGITPSIDSHMGSIAWDTKNFPDPKAFIANLRDEYGLGIIPIEEPYVSNKTADFDTLSTDGTLVRKCGEADCDLVKFNAWWGNGGMVDWTNPDASAWWHENRRKHLIDEGVVGHWTDLGEPEMFQASAWYYGFPEYDLHGQADIHNLYNFLWSKSIWDGYQRDGVTQRPFIMSRSGTAGSQRYGVSMWSGDIGANMPSLAAHMNAQMQMSLSGMDYFGSDVGGFYRQAFDLKISKDDMYTVWLANSSLLDVPLRPHTSNVNNEFQTAPALNGDVASNLANVRFRYMLTPYLYSAAHLAYREAAPLFAPLVYYFQSDPNVRTLGNQKMIGRDLMMAAITDNLNIDSVHTYLPRGGWFNVYTGEFIESAGEWIDVPTLVDGVRRAPLFARDGAIIPMMPVDDQTMNTLGKRRDGSTNNTLILNVYHASEERSTTVIDDDGQTMGYQSGDVWQTSIMLPNFETGPSVVIAPQNTTSENAPKERAFEIRLVSPNTNVTSVLLNGKEQPIAESMNAFNTQDTGWIVDEAGVIHVKSGTMDAHTALIFVFKE